MGWDSYHVYGKIDRKHECDLANTWDTEESSCKVLKSAMRGSTYYAACEYTDKKTGKIERFGSVCLTQVDNKDYFNFYIKKMEESVHPYYYDCSSSILNLLDETDNESANTWRENCRLKAAEKSKKSSGLGKLPIGTTIEFDWKGSPIRATKCAPCYQFKSTWWSCGSGYIKKKNIPETFRVIG